MLPATQSESEERLRTCAREAARGAGCDLLDLSIRKHGPRWTLVATVDRTGGVSVEDCARVSRALAAMLEPAEAIPQAYTLEVSSPGLTRPLAQPSDYERFRGRLALLQLRGEARGSGQLRGILAGLDGGGEVVRLQPAGGGAALLVPLADVAWARLDFDPPGAERRAAGHGSAAAKGRR